MKKKLNNLYEQIEKENQELLEKIKRGEQKC